MKTIIVVIWEKMVVSLLMMRSLLAGLVLELLKLGLLDNHGVSLLEFTMATWRFKSLRVIKKVHFASRWQYIQLCHFFIRTHLQVIGNSWTILSAFISMMFGLMFIDVIGQETNDTIYHILWVSIRKLYKIINDLLFKTLKILHQNH